MTRAQLNSVITAALQAGARVIIEPTKEAMRITVEPNSDTVPIRAIDYRNLEVE